MIRLIPLALCALVAGCGSDSNAKYWISGFVEKRDLLMPGVNPPHQVQFHAFSKGPPTIKGDGITFIDWHTGKERKIKGAGFSFGRDD